MNKNKDLIIRKRRKLSRKVIETAVLIVAWILVLLVIVANVGLCCHVTLNDMVTLYILFDLSAEQLNLYFSIFLILISFLFVVGYICYIKKEYHMELVNENI